MNDNIHNVTDVPIWGNINDTRVNVTDVPILGNITTVNEGNWYMREFWYWRIGLYALGGAFIEWAGIACNVISIIVLAHFRNRSSAPFLLICLSVFDSVYLFSMFVLEGLTLMALGKVINNGYTQLIAPTYGVLYPIPYWAQTVTIYLVVVITIERFTVVAWPFLADRFCSIRSAGFAVIMILFLTTLFHIPTYLAARCEQSWQNHSQSWRYEIVRTDFGKSKIYEEIYLIWVNLAVNFALPFILLLVFNAFTIRALRKSGQEFGLRQTLGREERRLTFMVVCMTSIFFLCELLSALSVILLKETTEYNQESDETNRFTAVADTFLLINSAINFAIYCVAGRKFREIFVHIFIRCKRTSLTSVAVQKSQQEYARRRLTSTSSKSSVQTRSTTETSLSSFINGARSSSKFTLSSENEHKRVSTRQSDGD